MNMRGNRWKWSCAVSEGNISEYQKKKGWKSRVVQVLGPVSIELGAIAQEVLYMGQTHFHCQRDITLTTQKQTLGYQTVPIPCKEQGIMYIKLYFIIDSGSL